jgi:protease IV
MEAIQRSYQIFLERVAASRGRNTAQLEPVAGGRVWTGEQARERGLIDELGGLGRALAEARARAGLRADAPLREASTGKRELPPALATAPATIGHALTAAAALNRAAVWWLSPFTPPE